MNNNSPNPLTESRGLLAIVLIGVFFVGWQWYMGKAYPPPPKASPVTATTLAPVSEKSATAPAVPSTTSQDLKNTTLATTEKTFKYEGQKVRFHVSSFGMGLKNVTLKNYADRKNEPVRLGESEIYSLFEMRLNNAAHPLVFDVTEKGPGYYVGTTESNGMKITREMRFDESKQSFENKVEIKDLKEGTVITLLVPEKAHAPQKHSFLFPSYDHQHFFIGHDDKNEAVTVVPDKATAGAFKNVHMVAVSSQYFTSAIMDQSDVVPEVKFAAEAGKDPLAELHYHPANAGAAQLSQIFFVGPKSIDILEKIHPDMVHLINLGSLDFIAKPMLLLMKGFFTLVSNWGLAIILLTLVVRLAVFPLYLMSTKSMKAMQKIQPLMKEIKEKYKDDPMTMNRETMALMKEHKANPLGGCLPMLLQIPIFFALYRIISVSVELYQAPFGLWIHDLSLHDPFYVLPVLMAGTMYLQTKMSPTTMDPAQAKIMAFMPIIFSIFMLNLPSGLTLYMFVSGLFGITQQYFMLRGGPAPTTVNVKASRVK